MGLTKLFIRKDRENYLYKKRNFIIISNYIWYNNFKCIRPTKNKPAKGCLLINYKDFTLSIFNTEYIVLDN